MSAFGDYFIYSSARSEKENFSRWALCDLRTIFSGHIMYLDQLEINRRKLIIKFNKEL
jgi:hypothetical protein